MFSRVETLRRTRICVAPKQPPVEVGEVNGRADRNPRRSVKLGPSAVASSPAPSAYTTIRTIFPLRVLCNLHSRNHHVSVSAGYKTPHHFDIHSMGIENCACYDIIIRTRDPHAPAFPKRRSGHSERWSRRSIQTHPQGGASSKRSGTMTDEKDLKFVNDAPSMIIVLDAVT
jgi:hypothetical protein